MSSEGACQSEKATQNKAQSHKAVRRICDSDISRLVSRCVDVERSHFKSNDKNPLSYLAVLMAPWIFNRIFFRIFVSTMQVLGGLSVKATMTYIPAICTTDVWDHIIFNTQYDVAAPPKPNFLFITHTHTHIYIYTHTLFVF